MSTRESGTEKRQPALAPARPPARFIKIRRIENVLDTEFQIGTFHTGSRTG